MGLKEKIETIAHSLAKEQYGRISSIEEGIEQGQFPGSISWSNFTCPICELADLQPVYHKRFVLKSGSIVGYACQTEDCKARGMLIPLRLVQSLLDEMTEQEEAQNETKC